MKLRKFIRGERFYFQMLDENGDIVLASQAYQSKDARNNGIESVKENIEDARRYEQISEGGNMFFILKAGNNQEIGRSRPFTSEAELQDALAYAIASRSSASSETSDPVPVSGPAQPDGGEAYGTDGKSDDYKPLKFYESHITGVPNGIDLFAAEGESYFTYNIGGKIFFISEGYKSDASRDNGIKSVEKNISIEDRYERLQHPNGKYFFNLRAGNHQEIATSRWFDSEVQMNLAIAKLLAGEAIISTKTIATDDTSNLKAANRIASVDIAAPIRIVDAEPKKKKRKKRSKSAKPKAQKVYLADGNYHFNGITYQLFRSSNNKHYFTFKNAEGKTILLNSDVRGFKTEAEGLEKIDQVLRYGPKENNYEGKTTRNNKYYFYLKGDEGKNIAKSFFFKTTEKMQASIGSLLGTVVDSEVPSPSPPTPAEKNPPAKEDDYLACRKYEEHIGSKSPNHEDFIVFEEGSEYFFAWVEDDGIVMRSERYTTEKARDNGIESVIKNRAIKKRFSIEEKVGHFFTVLKAGNHQEIARSCPHKDRVSAMYWYPGEVQKRANALVRSQAVEAAAGNAAVAAAMAVKDKKKVSDYLPCRKYVEHINSRSAKYSDFIVFEEGGEYYFAWVEDDRIVMRSERYATEKARDNGIESVIKNRDIEKRCSIDEKGGLYYVVLKAGNHQEIGRSCPYDERSSAMGFITSVVPIVAGVAAIPKPLPADKEDDYLKCAEYENRIVNDQKNNVALFKHANGQLYFALYDEDGDVKLRSEGFRTAEEREVELLGVLKYHANKDLYKRITKGSYCIDILYDTTGREIGRSCLKKATKAVPVAPIPAAGTIAAATVIPQAKSEPVFAHQPSSGGGFKWWWLIPILIILALLWFLFGNK